MITLYYKPTCPYCQRVLGEMENLGIKANLKDISTDDAVAQELIDLGGKRQVPYLVDDEHDLKMYESGDIIEHLKAHHSGSSTAKTDEECESCQ
ncbi:glutathione S-transferase N-terminal domain-containing protein [Candidatus Pacebacteria bacterium]|nr:glutathione S-transferase N-terminal domain-containing protein [Candidatus Paceibacterota bacterium]